jgi:hypothetical protein
MQTSNRPASTPQKKSTRSRAAVEIAGRADSLVTPEPAAKVGDVAKSQSGRNLRNIQFACVEQIARALKTHALGNIAKAQALFTQIPVDGSRRHI